MTYFEIGPVVLNKTAACVGLSLSLLVSLSLLFFLPVLSLCHSMSPHPSVSLNLVYSPPPPPDSFALSLYVSSLPNAPALFSYLPKLLRKAFSNEYFLQQRD